MPDINRTIVQGAHIDFSQGAQIKGISASTTSGHPVEHDQLASELSNKQGNLVEGDAISVTGDTVSISLGLSGTDYSGLTLSGLAESSLNGAYVRASYFGHFDDAGTALDFTYNAGNFDVYYKDNGGGVWAFLAKRSHDGTSDTGQWRVNLITTDPTTITADVTDLVPDYTAVDGNVPTYSGEVSDSGRRVPASADSNVAYASGSASYLKIDSNGDLAADVVTEIADVATGKLLDASTTKTYLDSEVATAKVAGNNSFTNAVAGLTGNPSNVQSAIESVASEVDTAETNISNIQTVNTTQGNNINAHSSALGIANGATDLGTFTNPALTDGASLKTVLEGFADAELTEHQNVTTSLGTSVGDTNFGSMVSNIYTDSSDAKALLEEAGSAIESLQVGQGAFWQAADYHHHDDSSDLPSTWGDGVTSQGSVVIDANGSNLSVAEMGTGDRILVIGGTVENGIYVVNADDSTSRAADADASTDFTVNKTVNIVNGGSHAGATYAYTGEDNPDLGTDNLPFTFKQSSNVADGSVTTTKLSTEVNATIEAKCGKHAETADIPATGYLTITHNLNSLDVAVSVKDSGGNYNNSLEIDEIDANSISIASVVAMTGARIVVIG